MADSLRVRILAARLRIILDQRLGRNTPEHVHLLARLSTWANAKARMEIAKNRNDS